MNYFRASALVRSRYLLAVLAGLLLAASFPKIGIAGFAWIAPALMLAAALGKRGWESFRIGYVAGLAYYLGSLYWLLLIPYRWHSIPLGPAAGWLSLSAYLALFTATWVWLLSGAHPAKTEGEAAEPPSPGVSGVAGWRLPVPGGVLARSWGRRALWAISGAALWVALEMIVARLWTGFPWNLLGSSQYQLTPMIQIASVTGIYGVSFLVVWVSLSLLSAGLMIVLRPTVRSIWVGDIFLPVVVVALAFNYGFRQLRHESARRTHPPRHAHPAEHPANADLGHQPRPGTVPRDHPSLRAGPDQPDGRAHLAGSRRAQLRPLGHQHLPRHHQPRPPASRVAGARLRRHRPRLRIAVATMPTNSTTRASSSARTANSSPAIASASLVVFGEYIPLVRWLPFVKWFTPIEGGFTPGDRPVPFALDNPDVKTSVLICFEDIFPHVAREYADDDTDFLVNLTNNGWFGESAAQWQHAAGALFRAVENGLPLIRCCNNGLTCWVDAHGRLRQVFRDDRGTVYGAGFLTAEIPLLGGGGKAHPHLLPRTRRLVRLGVCRPCRNHADRQNPALAKCPGRRPGIVAPQLFTWRLRLAACR